jgi:hypothetical protein
VRVSADLGSCHFEGYGDLFADRLPFMLFRGWERQFVLLQVC